MANCPKCNQHLKLSDWKQHCPHCGANIVIYDLQERLMQDADKAEVQYYHFQKKIDRLKASFVGSKLAIARIFTSLLPVGALFLPLVNATFKAPLEEMSGKIDVLAIYNGFDKLTSVLDIFSSPVIGDKLFIVAFALLLLSVLALVVRFVLNTLACSPKGKIRNYTMDVILLVTSIGAALCILAGGKGDMVSAKLGIGALLYIVLQIVNVVVDVMTFKKGIEIKHAQCYVGGIPIEEYFELEKVMSKEAIRAEQYKRLQIIQNQKEAELKEKEANANVKEGEAVVG